jgi:formamidopyrimidine-DNA glycosylase
MIEIPEAFHISHQISQHMAGKRIVASQAAASSHKFAWYEGDPCSYSELLEGKSLQSAQPVGGMIEIQLDDALIVLSEGAYPRLYNKDAQLPAKHQLFLQFNDGISLVVTVRMYGGILAFPQGSGKNEYYLLAGSKPSPLTEAFDDCHFEDLIVDENVQSMSAKAFLATEQRIPGLGNGVLQDILYFAGIHPKRKIADLDQEQRGNVFTSIKHTLQQMAQNGGRDTELDLLGQQGAYQTQCSKHTVTKPCPQCGDLIQKASYMGGSVYFCSTCQPL